MDLIKSVKFEDKQVLCDAMKGYDARKQLAKKTGYTFAKAYRQALKQVTTTLNTYAAGTLPVMIPVYVDPEIIDETRRACPMTELLPRVQNYGKYADFNVITTLDSALLEGEDQAPNYADDTKTRRHLQIRMLRAYGRVTGYMYAASKPYLESGGYIDALALEVKNRTIALKRLEENAIFLGDSVADWTDYNSTTQDNDMSFDGLYQLISNANSNGLGGSSSYVTDNAGAALTVAIMRASIQTCRTGGGDPNLMVCDYATYDTIKGLLDDNQRYINTTNIAWGITSIVFEGIPIIASRFLSTDVGAGTGVPADAKSLFILDTNVIEMRVLQDATYEELGQQNDSKRFMVKEYVALVVKAPVFNHVVYDIA